jgi:hypothetical protein
MGMYTALHFAADVSQAPKEVVDVLDFMAGNTEVEPTPLPSHEFFKAERWRVLFRMDSEYFSADTHCSFKNMTITVTSNLKNYDSEIEKFLDWVMPYVSNYEGEFLGYRRYEEDNEPTLIYKTPQP